ncbi:hypothetical protein, partial [Salmonella enterica]|uniref:hypothetical protein n=1 Tax=Salmonella enterica TaxID=28901 RepID=UPI001CB751D5
NQNTLQRIFTHFICILIHSVSMKQCKFAYPWISGKRRHSEEVILFKRQKDQLSDDRKRLRFLEFAKNWLA